MTAIMHEREYGHQVHRRTGSINGSLEKGLKFPIMTHGIIECADARHSRIHSKICKLPYGKFRSHLPKLWNADQDC